MSHPLSASTVVQLPDCFHVTQRCNLGKIQMEGLVPGGNGIQSRMLTFFNPYAPWDYRAWKITKSVNTRLGGYTVLYIPTETLFTTFNARLTDSGQVVTEHVTPFSFIRGGWFQDSQLRWVRLMVPSGPEQAIRTAIKLSHVASKESCSGSHLLASQAKPRRATRRSRLRG